MLRHWFDRLSTRKGAQKERARVRVEYRESDGLPMGLPAARELRTLAQYLEDQNPVSCSLDLTREQRYTLAHELAGYHDAVASLRDLADTLDADEANQLNETHIEL